MNCTRYGSIALFGWNELRVSVDFTLIAAHGMSTNSKPSSHRSWKGALIFAQSHRFILSMANGRRDIDKTCVRLYVMFFLGCFFIALSVLLRFPSAVLFSFQWNFRKQIRKRQQDCWLKCAKQEPPHTLTHKYTYSSAYSTPCKWIAVNKTFMISYFRNIRLSLSETTP